MSLWSVGGDERVQRKPTHDSMFHTETPCEGSLTFPRGGEDQTDGFKENRLGFRKSLSHFHRTDTHHWAYSFIAAHHQVVQPLPVNV